ncbi:alkaline phosphatase family protein [Cupriavidus basilensis]
MQGAWYTQEVLNALTANPDVWSKTVLLINFDENDGFFDHVPPPCAPAYDANGVLAGNSTVATDGEYHTDKHPYGPGPRVPMYVVSPWSRGGWVNSQVFDHTSVLRFLEARFGIAEANYQPLSPRHLRRHAVGLQLCQPEQRGATQHPQPHQDRCRQRAHGAGSCKPQVALPTETAQAASPANQAAGTRPLARPAL